MRVFWSVGVASFLYLSLTCTSFAVTRYVDAACTTPAAPYTNWGIAATNIPAAINEAASGDEILVAPGVYLAPVNGVQIPFDKTLTLRSTQSRAAVIDGQNLYQGMLIRGTNSLVEGFTIRNGFTDNYGGGLDLLTVCTLRDCLVTSNRAYGAGGVCFSAAAVVENCTIQSNLATYFGGGVIFYSGAQGQLNNCIISDNLASNYSGGVSFQGGGTASNCWISGNRAVLNMGGGIYIYQCGALINSVVVSNFAGEYGGGIYSSGSTNLFPPVVNCTIVSNTAGVDGGGVYASYNTLLFNDIVYYNTAPTNANLYNFSSFSIVSNCCVTPDAGGSNFTNAPTFVNATAMDFHLATGSSCIDTGTNSLAPAIDYDGHPRPVVGTPGGTAIVDVGAFEYAFHFNDILSTQTNELQFLWDVQDRGVYALDVATNGAGNPAWLYITNYSGTALGVHTQTVVIPSPAPVDAVFRLRVSHTPGPGR